MPEETRYDPSHVRERPSMYVGGIDNHGLFYCFIYIYTQAFEEYKMGFADHIEITLLPNNGIRIADNGRGISDLENAMTILTRKAENLPVVNALSKYMTVSVYRDGEIHTQEYAEGRKKTEVKNLGKTTLHGTVFEFELDKTIFGGKIFDHDQMCEFIYEQFLICSSLRLSLVDLRDNIDYKNDLSISKNIIFVSDMQSTIAMKVQSYRPRRY